MRNILLMAYQISPTKGSEYGVGWNFLINLSKNNKVYIICGASGNHMGELDEIEEYFKINPNTNIKLITIYPSKTMNFINYFNKIGIKPMFYIAYKLWHLKAYERALSIIKDEKIDLIHHLNPIGFREPGYLWKINKPFIWGPVGGAVFINKNLLKHIPIFNKFLFLLKNNINLIQLRFNSRVRKACNKASTIIFANTDNKKAFEKYLNVTGEVISEQGTFSVENNTLNSNENVFKIVWAGRIDFNKNLFLLLNICSKISSNKDWKLNIIGDGKIKNSLFDFAKELNLENNITWHGIKTRFDTINIIKDSNLHIITSLFEGNPAVMNEAISYGVPTISLDQNGMHDTLKNGNGILIPISTYDETVNLFAKSITNLINNPLELKELKNKTKQLALDSMWEDKIKKFEDIYDIAIKNYESKK